MSIIAQKSLKTSPFHLVLNPTFMMFFGYKNASERRCQIIRIAISTWETKKDLPSILWFVLVLLSTNKNSTKFRENFSRFLVWWFTNVDTSESLRVKSGIIAAELNSWLIIDADNVRKFISGVRETRVGQKSVKKIKYLVL